MIVIRIDYGVYAVQQNRSLQHLNEIETSLRLLWNIEHLIVFYLFFSPAKDQMDKNSSCELKRKEQKDTCFIVCFIVVIGARVNEKREKKSSNSQHNRSSRKVIARK